MRGRLDRFVERLECVDSHPQAADQRPELGDPAVLPARGHAPSLTESSAQQERPVAWTFVAIHATRHHRPASGGRSADSEAPRRRHRASALVGAPVDIDFEHSELQRGVSPATALAKAGRLYVRAMNYGWLLTAWLQVQDPSQLGQGEGHTG